MELRAIGDWLLEKDAQAQNALRYYLGPAYEPINALAQFGALMSPGADMMDMAQSSNALMNSPTWKDAGLNALGLGAATLGAFIPGTARGIEEAVDTAADATRKGIRAYHGSPHDFDKFDSSRIGTGEGAQAYGHGLYFAGNEDVAQMYKHNLAAKGDEWSFDGQPLTSVSDWARVQGQLDTPETWREWKVLDHLTKMKGSVEDRMREAREWYRTEPKMAEAVDTVEARMGLKANPGRMYEVNINADPADFLDWDLPLAGQSKAVQERVRGLAPRAAGMSSGHRLLSEVAPSNATPFTSAADRAQAEASDRLREAGIPGIKYLDQGSRAAGEGSRNYVVFDDNLISILRKYGLLGMIGGGAAVGAASQNYGDGA